VCPVKYSHIKNLRDATINIEIKSGKNARIKVKPSGFLAQAFSDDGHWFVDEQRFICLKFKRYTCFTLL